jgi:hypothetical protein
MTRIRPGTARRLGLRLPVRYSPFTVGPFACSFELSPRARFILDHYPHLLTMADLKRGDGVQIGKV